MIKRRVMEEAICASLCNPQAAANPELRVKQLQHPLPILYRPSPQTSPYAWDRRRLTPIGVRTLRKHERTNSRVATYTDPV